MLQSNLFVYDETQFIAVGDVFTVILCVMLIALFTITYVTKDKVFHMFQAMIGLLMIASWSDLLWHSLIMQGTSSDTLIYIVHFVFRMATLAILYIFSCYTS